MLEIGRILMKYSVTEYSRKNNENKFVIFDLYVMWSSKMSLNMQILI